MSFGFAEDGAFQVVAANEILPNMAKAYSLNHPGVRMYCKDIHDLSYAEIRADLDLGEGDVELVVGGPPCQAYSTVGKRLIDDPRGMLFQQYYRMLKEIQPKVFIFENVKGLLSMQGGALLDTIRALFESLGYRVQYELLNAADYGAPQIRERVIIVGTRLRTPFRFPQPTHYNPDKDSPANVTQLFSSGLRPYRTLGEAIGDLPPIKSGEESTVYWRAPETDFQRRMREGAPARLMDHNAPRNNERMVRLMELLPEGGSPEDLPPELRPSSGFKNTYCRLWWDRPSTTITRNLGTPSSSRCIHPRAPRPLTTREGARLQCFPDRYMFAGSRSQRNLQIGNAVPTVLSIALKDQIKVHFAENNQAVPAERPTLAYAA